MSAAEPRRAAPAEDERVDEAVDESFPASDPPAWQGGATTGAPARVPDRPRRQAPVKALLAVAAVIVVLWLLFG